MQVIIKTEIGNHDQGADHVVTVEMTPDEIRDAVKKAASAGWERYTSVCLPDGREIAYARRKCDRCGDTRPEWHLGSWGVRAIPDGKATETGIVSE